MAGESSLLEGLFTLSLLVSVAGIGYLLFKSRKELGRYKVIFDEALDQQNLLPYLKLDKRLNITACNLAAQDLFQRDHLALTTIPFAEILPVESRERIVRIYRKRLGRHGRLVLRHQVSIGENSVKQGQWLIIQDPSNHHYHAFFRVDSSSHIHDSPVYDLLDSKLGVWEMNWPAALIFHNAGWLEHLGYKDSSSINKLPTWFSLVSSADRDRVKKSIQDATADTPFKIQYGFTTEQGTELQIETRGFVTERDSEGKPVIIMGIHSELTKDEDRFPGKAIRHELMNKLASVLGYSELIRSYEKIPGQIKDFAEEVMISAEQIRLLLQPGKNAKISAPSMDKIAKKYDLAFTGDPVIPPSISSSVVETAIASVIEFMRKEGNDNGQRSITTISQGIEQCSACDREPDEAAFVITITDAGLQFDRDHLRYLLTPGFVTAVVGDRINLVQVSDLMHQHGGHIRLTIGDSGFSTVLLFPVTTMKRPLPIRIKKSGNNILIIDDDLAVADFLKEVIQQAGYNATVFTDPSAALAQFKENPERFDLVITDQIMPGVSGDVVIQTMLAKRPELPIILCTGYSETIDASVALELGAVGYVTKPVKVSHLVNIIQHALAVPAS